jgi:hypothetical protein
MKCFVLMWLLSGCAAAVPAPGQSWTAAVHGEAFDYSPLFDRASAEDAQRVCYLIDPSAHTELIDYEHLNLMDVHEEEWALTSDHANVEPWPNPSLQHQLPYRCMRPYLGDGGI